MGYFYFSILLNFSVMSVYYYFYNNERQTFLIANNNNNKHLKNLEDSFAVNILELNYTDILYL